jgi:hypothetical protein
MRRLLKRLESAIMRACVAEMAEQVDARDSKSRAARRAGSIPALGTSSIQQNKSDLHDVTVAFFISAVSDLTPKPGAPLRIRIEALLFQ